MTNKEIAEQIFKNHLEYEQSKVKVSSSNTMLKEGVCRCFEPIKKIDAEGKLRCGWCYGKMEQANSLL